MLRVAYSPRLTTENKEWVKVQKSLDDGSWKAQTDAFVARDVEKFFKGSAKPPAENLDSNAITLAEDALLQVWLQVACIYLSVGCVTT